MVNDHYPLLNGYNWECTLFSDKPIYDGSRAAKDQLPNSFGQIHSAEIHFSGLAGWTKHLKCCGEGGLWQLSHCGCVQVYDWDHFSADPCASGSPEFALYVSRVEKTGPIARGLLGKWRCPAIEIAMSWAKSCWIWHVVSTSLVNPWFVEFVAGHVGFLNLCAYTFLWLAGQRILSYLNSATRAASWIECCRRGNDSEYLGMSRLPCLAVRLQIAPTRVPRISQVCFGLHQWGAEIFINLPTFDKLDVKLYDIIFQHLTNWMLNSMI